MSRHGLSGASESDSLGRRDCRSGDGHPGYGGRQQRSAEHDMFLNAVDAVSPRDAALSGSSSVMDESQVETSDVDPAGFDLHLVTMTLGDAVCGAVLDQVGAVQAALEAG